MSGKQMRKFKEKVEKINLPHVFIFIKETDVHIDCDCELTTV